MNVYKPMMIRSVIKSITLLTDGGEGFRASHIYAFENKEDSDPSRQRATPGQFRTAKSATIP